MSRMSSISKGLPGTFWPHVLVEGFPFADAHGHVATWHLHLDRGPECGHLGRCLQGGGGRSSELVTFNL